MKKIILFLSLSFIFLSCSKLSLDHKGYVTAFEGYQLFKEYMHKENFDTSCINLISISSDVGNIIFSGNDIGKSDAWHYLIQYKYNNEVMYSDLYYSVDDDGQPTIYIDNTCSVESIVKEYGGLPKEYGKYIKLAKQNDSPVFVKKLLENSEFIKSLITIEENGDDTGFSFSYLSKDDAEFESNNIKINENVPYWKLYIIRYKSNEIGQLDEINGGKHIRKTWIMQADENIKNYSLEYIAMKPYTAYEGYQFVKDYLERHGYDTSYINLISVYSDIFSISYTNAEDDLGCSDSWYYILNYSKNNIDEYIKCYYSIHFCLETLHCNGYQIIEYDNDYTKEDFIKEFGELPKNFIYLTKENDSPVFFRELAVADDEFNEKKNGIVSLSYLSNDYLKGDISIKNDIPYWTAYMYDYKDTTKKTYYTLTPNKKIIKTVRIDNK